MQAWALTQGASGEGHRTHGRNIQKDEPSSPKNAHALSSSSGCTEAKLAFLEDDWDQRADGPEVGRADRVGFLEPSCPGSLDASREGAHSQSSEFEDSADSAFLNETYSIHYCESERKNESLPHSPSELGCEVQSTTGACFDVLDHHSKKVIGWERACEISDDGYGETAGAAQQRELDEDSQQEYHSAEEQEDTSAPVPPDQTRTSHTPDLGVVGSRNSGHEVESACCLDGSQVKLASESTIFLDSADVYGQEDAPRGSKFQGSVVVREYHEPEQEVCKEQETSLMYHTAFDDLVLGSSPFENQGSRSRSSFVNPQKALEAKMYTGKVKCQRIESKAFCRHEVVEKDVSHHLGNPSTLRQDRALQMSLQPRKDGRPPWTPVFDESVISACGCSHYINLQSTLRPASGLSAPAPSTAVRAPEAVGDPSLKASAGGTASDTSVRSPELAMRAAGTTVTVAQTVDVCSDFRARFTTSRATSARPSVVSTSTNTDIIAADRRRPGDWQGAGRRSVACNTEGPHGREPGRAPVPRSRGPPGSPLSGGHSQPRGDFHSEDSLELRKTSAITDLRKHLERESPLFNEMETSLPSRCCEEIMQRAVRAELHLLDLHYWMCRHHCRDIYKLITDSREGLNRILPSNSKKELGLALLSVMGDLKVRYESLKDRINQGRPLEELLPLSVESKLLSAFSTLVSTLMKETSNVLSGADSELDHQITCDVDVSSGLKKALSQLALGTTLEGCDWLEGTSCPDQTDAESMSSLHDRSPPEQDTLPKELGLKTGDIDVDFSQLKLDDQGCRNDREVSENWFDAKDSLTGLDLSGVPESQVEKDGGDPRFARDLKTTEPLRKDKGYLIHVGGLCPSVSEADLRSHFQKYHVSEISIYDSPNYRYASLALKKNIDAKTAVKEMNGKEISGKPVKVRLVKTPGEHTLSLSHRGTEGSSGREMGSPASASRLPRTRPRQLGPGQDHEGVKKNCKQIESTKLLPDTPIQFIPPNTLNLSSFTKIMKRLAELHPGVSRDCILDALQDVRANHKGFLNGLSINSIVEMTSSVLKNSDSS